MIIDGRQISQKVLEGLKEEIRQKKLKLRLAAVLVSNPVRGKTSASGGSSADHAFQAGRTSNGTGIRKFVELKGKAAKEVGIDYEIFEFTEIISEGALRDEVRKIVQYGHNNGVLVELPLPKGINAQNVLNEISIEKDVDVLSQKAQDRFYSNNSMIFPPAVEAVKTVLEFHKFDLKGPDTKGVEDPRFANYALRRANRDKKAAVFGQGLLVGKPVAHWLSQSGADVSVIDEHTENPSRYSLKADIIVSGVGEPELIGGDMAKDSVVAIDFGYENKEGKMVGDFKFDEVSAKASLITPVPGGIGPVVVAAVIKNLVRLNSLN